MIDPQPIALDGEYVRLEPLRPEHTEDLIAVGLGHDLFRWFPYRIATEDDMRTFVRVSLSAQEAGTTIPFVTVERTTGRVVGSTSFLAIDRANHRLEIGATWIAPAWQRTACNSEAKYLQLRHCFEDLGCLRVEFKTDALNEKSRAALQRLGAVQEGIFRNHMICPGGRRRDSVYFSVIDSEWPELRRRLEERLRRV